MIYKNLGRSDLKVSLICLGTMTWGEQNSEADAHDQLDFALANGVNFIDTAETYPVPPAAATYGTTERYIGSWLKKHGRRDEIVLATKAAGPATIQAQSKHIRGGQSRFDRKNLEQALHGSLQRLQTDYIDLYQLHWPDRVTNRFGVLNYTHVEEETVPIDETLRVLDDFVRAGKIRHIGVSNETPWGVLQFLHASERHGLARVVSIQNPYNLLNRTFEIHLAEVAHREQVGLLAYSPLGFGVLSGKYLDGARPEGARLSRWERFARYSNPQALSATRDYVALARRRGLDPAQLALAFVNSRPFVTANIIGATTLEQLRVDIESATLELTPEILAEIEDLHRKQPNPAP